MSQISDNKDRSVLLTYLDLCGDVSELVNKYAAAGVPVMTIVSTLEAKARDTVAIACLPDTAEAK